MFPTLMPTTTFMTLVFLCLSSLHVVKAVPAPGALWIPRLVRREARDCANEPPDSIVRKNGLDAQKLNQDFKSMQQSDRCEGEVHIIWCSFSRRVSKLTSSFSTDGQTACIQSGLARCISARWTLEPCGSGRECFALPYDNEPGTSIECEVQSIAEARFDAACTQGGPYGPFLAPRHDECDGEEPDDGYSEGDNDGYSGGDNDPADCSSEDDNEEPADGPSEDDGEHCDEGPASDSALGGEDDCDGEDPPNSEPPSRGDLGLTTFTTTLTITPSPTESGGGQKFRVGPRQVGNMVSRIDHGVPMISAVPAVSSRSFSTGSFSWDTSTSTSS